MSGKKIYKFAFNAYVQSVSLNLKFPCVVSVTWRRGDKISQVKQRKQIDKGIIAFNQNLQLECNMNFDTSTKKFQEKKTKFTVLIFSEKGNKQAGQVNFDVSQFLNTKQKEQKVQRMLQKCPDKNAKINFILTAYLIKEVQEETVSHRSQNPVETVGLVINQSAIQQPDFKKKKPEHPPLPQGKEEKKQDKNNQQNGQQRIPTVNKANKQRIKLEQQNRRLKQQLQQLRQLQKENNILRKSYQQAQKKSQSYYLKKLEQAKRQLAQLKSKAKTVESLQQKKYDLQKQMCDCKEQMGRILNFAITNKNNEMAEEIYNIYQNSKP